ncbi:MAG: hypothetical protein ABSB83_07490 [Methanomassiliicoccales archaeon]|jgi:hypothetical protein
MPNPLHLVPRHVVAVHGEMNVVGELDRSTPRVDAVAPPLQGREEGFSHPPDVHEVFKGAGLPEGQSHELRRPHLPDTSHEAGPCPLSPPPRADRAGVFEAGLTGEDDALDFPAVPTCSKEKTAMRATLHFGNVKDDSGPC